MADSRPVPQYEIKSVVRACRVLKAFRSSDESLRLQEIAARADLRPPTALRLLRTLESCGFVARDGDRSYCSLLGPLKSPLRTVGFTVDVSGKPFRREVALGLEQAASEHGVELVSIKGEGTPRNALRAADRLIRQHVDAVIDFQTDRHVGESVAAKYLEAGIPTIAVDIPHPGCTFFGVNNFAAGREGGRWLARWVRRHWRRKIDTIVLVGASHPDVTAARVRGAWAALEERLPTDSTTVIELDTPHDLEAGFRSARSFLRSRRGGKTLILEPTDPGVMGALLALDEAASPPDTVLFGFGGDVETRMALRQPGARLIGCLGFEPERYGEKLIPTALRLIERRAVPPAVFVEHEVLTPENVDLVYPNDRASAAAAG